MQPLNAPSGPQPYPVGGGGDAWGTQITGLNRKTADWQKVDPASVHYRPSGSGERCGTCQMSQFPPGSTQGICSLVAGTIDYNFVCDQFSALFTVSAQKEEMLMNLDSARATVGAFDYDSLCWIDYSRQFTEEQRDALAKKGNAEADGSYPIENVGDLRNAIHAIGRSKNPAKTKAHIRKRAKALGASNLIPGGWGDDGDNS